MNHISIEKLSDDELKKIVLSTGGGQVPCFTSRLDGEIKEEIRRRFVSPDLKTSIHMLLNGIKECRKCPACGNEYPAYGVKNGWYNTCSLKCRYGVVDKDEKERKRRETCLKKYGVGNPSQNAKVREKIKNTFTERYGEDYMADLAVKARARLAEIGYDVSYGKAKRTCMERYGVEHSSQSSKSRETWMNTWLTRKPELRPLYEDKEVFECEITKIGIMRMATKYGVDLSTMQRLCKIHGVNSRKPTRPESMVGEFLGSLGVEYSSYNRSVLGDRELDFYIESLSLAIEVNGLFYHSTDGARGKTDPLYHLKKLESCEKRGIKLLQFDDWTIKTDFDSLKPVILSHLGDTSNDCKIDGEVVEIDNMGGDRAAVERLGYRKIERKPPTFLLTDGSKITTDGHRKYFNCGVDVYVKS